MRNPGNTLYADQYLNSKHPGLASAHAVASATKGFLYKPSKRGIKDLTTERRYLLQGNDRHSLLKDQSLS